MFLQFPPGLAPERRDLLTDLAGWHGENLVGLILSGSAGRDMARMWLWFRVRRPGSAARAWLLAVLGTVLVIGGSNLPVTIVGKAVHEEWQETQPGDRGYHPPTGSR